MYFLCFISVIVSFIPSNKGCFLLAYVNYNNPDMNDI